MTRRGRPTRLTRELHERIVRMVALGVPTETAAIACGVPRSTFYEWRQRAAGKHERNSTKALDAFGADLEVAVARSEARLALKVAEYIEGARPSRRNPTRRVRSRLSYKQVCVVQWELARRFPSRWGSPTTSVHVGRAPGDDESGTEVGAPEIRILLHAEAAIEPIEGLEPVRSSAYRGPVDSSGGWRE